MSVSSWRGEFYPLSAFQATGCNPIEHSVLKWRGLSKENLVKHGLVADMEMVCITEPVSSMKRKIGDCFMISDYTCALCALTDNCSQCALSIFACAECNQHDSPWLMFLKTGDPQPMVEALESIVGQNPYAAMHLMDYQVSKLEVRLTEEQRYNFTLDTLPEEYRDLIPVLEKRQRLNLRKPDMAKEQDLDTLFMYNNAVYTVDINGRMISIVELMERGYKVENLITAKKDRDSSGLLD